MNPRGSAVLGMFLGQEPPPFAGQVWPHEQEPGAILLLGSRPGCRGLSALPTPPSTQPHAKAQEHTDPGCRNPQPGPSPSLPAPPPFGECGCPSPLQCSPVQVLLGPPDVPGVELGVFLLQPPQPFQGGAVSPHLHSRIRAFRISQSLENSVFL